MKKLSFSVIAMLLTIAFIAILMSGCTKMLQPSIRTIGISFDVEEQASVSHYVIQTSKDGKVFQDKGSINADNSKVSTTYNIQVQQDEGRFYLRIKSVDIDNQFDYSKVILEK